MVEKRAAEDMSSEELDALPDLSFLFISNLACLAWFFLPRLQKGKFCRGPCLAQDAKKSFLATLEMLEGTIPDTQEALADLDLLLGERWQEEDGIVDPRWKGSKDAAAERAIMEKAVTAGAGFPAEKGSMNRWRSSR